jgi:hypothetical protein
MHIFTGGCHCGTIGVELQLAADAATITPRACDCDFCSKHAAAYLSDPAGSLTIRLTAPDSVSHYRQGSRTAVFLLCRNCGVLAGVYYQAEGKLYAAVNSKILANRDAFGTETSVSPKTLTALEKTQRWQNVWFADVEITEGAISP